MKTVGITYRFEEKLGPYAAAVRAAGLEPVPISPLNPQSLSGCNGLLVSGGTDLDPALYGEAANSENELPDRERDRLELDLLREALSRDMPVFAICRGMQVLNVLLGGTLEQHLPGTSLHRQRFGEDMVGEHRAIHDVAVAGDSKLATIVGAGNYPVNSRHHQAVKRIGLGLHISAKANDGVVEAMEAPDRRWVVAVQWHPEDRITAAGSRDMQLFRAFGAAL